MTCGAASISCAGGYREARIARVTVLRGREGVDRGVDGPVSIGETGTGETESITNGAGMAVVKNGDRSFAVKTTHPIRFDLQIG